MKTKSAIIIVSVLLNVGLFSALAYFNKINSRAEGTPALFFLHQHLPEVGYFHGYSHGVALASTVK